MLAGWKSRADPPHPLDGIIDRILKCPMHYMETFIVESSGERLRQHERVIMADRALEEDVGRFEAKPRVTHFSCAHSKTKTQAAPT